MVEKVAESDREITWRLEKKEMVRKSEGMR